ncbi:response regulator transcription factor [Paenibacillus sp. SC116]|uniref:response regulator transcription factor n=1 Tax=Paenibacillus sp. SC116 TaxID=2968986 RepID=UPI00215AB705|nr:response regulator transcription factor [Paenibacillus sp. SC116]MCR8845892.1 response regulator transcription factor [Paenibacillus sp. SC116]
MSLHKKVLIVDDEEDIVRLLKTVLNKEGIEHVYTAATAADAITQFEHIQPDVVVLDIMLPDGEGYDVCQKIRNISTVPILFLSAKTEEIDKLLGLAIGGDDYITKPFSPKEVAYRIKAHFRRADYQIIEEPTVPLITVGPFEFDHEKTEFRKHGQVIELKPKEVGLMALFMKHPNQIISKETICQHVWGEDYFGFDNTVMVHIRRLREKIEVDPSNPTYLITVKGLGYKLVKKDE